MAIHPDIVATASAAAAECTGWRFKHIQACERKVHLAGLPERLRRFYVEEVALNIDLLCKDAAAKWEKI